MTKEIEWRGPDVMGYLYQSNHFAGFGQFNIAIPGRGAKPHKGPGYKLYYAGEEIGSYGSDDAAMAAADQYLEKLRGQK